MAGAVVKACFMMLERRSTWKSRSPGLPTFKVDSRSCRTSHQLYSCFADHNHLGSFRAAVCYSDTWQLVINTGTTIITFLMVFLIQKTQNRDTETIHLKLDELIRVTKGARNMMLDLEHMDDESRWLDLPLPLKGGFPP